MNGQVLKWNGAEWIPSDESGGSPTGTAGGDLSGIFPNPTVTSIQGKSISSTSPSNGQVLKWNGTQWVPEKDSVGDNWGTQTVQVNTTLTGKGTVGNPLSIGQQGAITGQVLKWNGTQWSPEKDSVGDNWGTQYVQVNSTLSGDGTTGNLLSIAQQGASTGQVLKWNGAIWEPSNESAGTPSGTAGGDLSGTYPYPTVASIQGKSISSKSPSNGQVLKWNGTQWAPGTDSSGVYTWGTQTVQTNPTLSGNGTTGNLLSIAQHGATTGQVLKWNGAEWVPGTDSSVVDTWGTQTVQTNPILSGNGTTGNLLSIAQHGATTGQVLKWNGTQWAPEKDSIGDNWGTQNVQVNGTLSGDGTIGNPLSIAQQGAATDQVLKWNGAEWVPGIDSSGADNWGTQTVQTNPTLSGDGTTGNLLSIAQQSATTGQVLKWNGTQWVPGTDSTNIDTWGTQTVQTNSTLSGNGTTGNLLSIAQHGATTGQVLKWNGTQWAVANDSVGSAIGTAGGDLSGTYPNPTVSKIQGDSISSASPSTGQILKWDGTKWTNQPDGLTLPFNKFYEEAVDVFHIVHDGAGGQIFYMKTTNSLNANPTLTVTNYGTGIAGIFEVSNLFGSNALRVESNSNDYAMRVTSQGSSTKAAIFVGNVDISGTLTKGAGSFKIDHPLDPENKFLYHSFVESPDMMNVYNGNIILDNKGEAIVELPEYFEALNKDFRYQLTCIGGFAPVYIAEEITNNKFKIAGGTPVLKVSWQVTGIRHDLYAVKNRIQVEVEKTDEERGQYLQDKEYNQPVEKSIGGIRKHEIPEKSKNSSSIILKESL